jgi:hypothetical protein
MPEVKEDTATVDEAVKSEEELLEQVEKNLAKTFGNEPSPTPDTPAASEDDDTPPEDKAAEDTDVVEDDPKPDKTDDKPDAGAEEDTEVVLPDAYRRTAINQGWTEEEIAEEFKANPDRALRTLGKIHDSTNKLNVKFAELGRVKLEKPAPAVKPDEVKPAEKPKVDLSKLEETYKDDELFNVVKGLVKANEDMSSELSEFRTKATEAPAVSKAEQDALVSEISGFFESDQTKFYEDFYGKSKGNDWGGLTQDQFKHRNTVTVVADQIAAGRALQGDEISNAEALEAAHTIVSSDFLKEAVSNGIKATLKKREKSITFKPDSQARKQEDEDGKPKNQAELERKTQERLNKTFSK